MSFNHKVICITNNNEEREIILSKAERVLYDYSIKKINGFYDEDVLDLFNYMINTYIMSAESISKWLVDEIELNDFDYVFETLKNHKMLLKVLQLCNSLNCNIGSDIISKLISISILRTPEENISDLVNFDE